MVVINGLKPSIRQHILQKDAQDMEAVRKWAVLAELSLQDAANGYDELEE